MSPDDRNRRVNRSAAKWGGSERDATVVDEQPEFPVTDGPRRGTRLRDVTAITKALADETRVRVLMTLTRGELCVCQIVELIGLATSTMSKHMSILRQAGLVESRKEGRWIYYRLADDEAPSAVQGALAWLAETLSRDPQVGRDRQRVATICNSDPQELCAGKGKGTCDCR